MVLNMTSSKDKKQISSAPDADPGSSSPLRSPPDPGHINKAPQGTNAQAPVPGGVGSGTLYLPNSRHMNEDSKTQTPVTYPGVPPSLLKESQTSPDLKTSHNSTRDAGPQTVTPDIVGSEASQEEPPNSGRSTIDPKQTNTLASPDALPPQTHQDTSHQDINHQDTSHQEGLNGGERTPAPGNASFGVEAAIAPEQGINYTAGGGKWGRFSFKFKRQDKPNNNPQESISKRILARAHKTLSVKVEDLSEEQVIIAVMGPTGSGKSSFIGKVTGDETGIGHDLQSCTTDINIVKVECLDRSDFDVVFVDTPGFDDTNRSDVEILEMIATWLTKTYERKITLAGILYFHRISDNRMAGTPLKNLRMFKELCGKNALQNIILTTTMWDEVDKETGDQREKELREKYWKAMIDQGSATARYQGTATSAWEIVDHFVAAANNRHAVQLQEEMVDMQKKLRETNAGQKLYTTLEVLVYKQQETLQKIRAETKRHADERVIKALKAEYEVLRKQLTATVEEMQTLRLPLGKRLLRMIWSPIGLLSRK